MTLALRSPLLTRHGFRHGFSLRFGGVSEAPFDSLNLARGVGDDPERVAENHRLFAREIGYGADRLYEVSQVHGAHVEHVQLAVAPEEFRKRQADALCVARLEGQAAGTAIGVRVADCAAVLFANPKTGAVAAAHAGWRGVVSGVLAGTLKALSAEPAQLIAAVFPHIGVDSFEVGDDVAAQIAKSAPEDPQVIMAEAGAGGRKPNDAQALPRADLGRAIMAQLLRAGLLSGNIERLPGCTFREPARFFSYRRDGAASGRHLAVIVAGC